MFSTSIKPAVDGNNTSVAAVLVAASKFLSLVSSKVLRRPLCLMFFVLKFKLPLAYLLILALVFQSLLIEEELDLTAFDMLILPIG